MDSRTRTCQGHSPKVAPLPPTIRPVFTNGRTPQSKPNMETENKIGHPTLVAKNKDALEQSSVSLQYYKPQCTG